MSLLDAPNQQAVRADGSGPGIDDGGGGPEAAAPEVAAFERYDTLTLDEMSKDQLLAYAQEIGVSPANAGMNKEDLRAGIDAKLAGEPA